MKLTGHIEKWGSGVLGALSLALLVNLVLQFDGVRAGSRHLAPPTTSRNRLERVSIQGADELARYDPVVRLDLLKQIEERPLPELARNPFEFEALPARPSATQPASGVASPAPPPPPPVTLKPMGYSEKAGGIREAYVTEEDQVYVVHEGETVATKYKVIKITPSVITVEDVSLHQTIELPIPQQ